MQKPEHPVRRSAPAKTDPASRIPRSAFRYYDLILALFVTVLLTSNIASSAKIIDWRVSLPLVGLPLAFDGGTLLFPISYIFGDVLTEVYGYAASRRVIWTGFAMVALMGVTLWVVARMPGEATWQQATGQAAYDAILGGVSKGGILIASIVAYFCGEFSNSYVLATMKVWTQGRYLWTRTIGSTLVGEGIDSTVFVAVACSFGVFPWSVALSIIVANYLFKVGIEVLFTPVTYRVVNWLKRVEHEDYFDVETDFNPFKLAVNG